MGKLISTVQAARLLGFTRQYVGELLREGELRGIKLERQWVVDEDDVIKYKKQKDKNKQKK